MFAFRVFVVACFCLLTSLARAAGFSTIDIPADSQGPAFRAAVWTPCATAPTDMHLGFYVIPGVRDCPIAKGQVPLIVFSHGYGGSFLGHHDTAETLANAGFAVAAITHSGDNFQIRGGSQDSVVALATRTTDMRRLVDYLLQSWPSRASLDGDRIGFFGFSRGGYTGLVLAGAQPDFERLPAMPSSPCQLSLQSPSCLEMQRRFRELLAAPLAHDPRIKAAVIVDPFSAVFAAGQLQNVRIPIQLWSSTYGGDGVTPQSVARVRDSLPLPPEWHVAENAAHFGFLAPCMSAPIQY